MDNAIVLVYDLCRLCLDEPGSKNIFTNANLARDIFICTGIEASHTDKLPQTVCLKCLIKIEAVKDFRDLVARNNAQLRLLLNDANSNENKKDIFSSLNNAETVVVNTNNQNIENAYYEKKRRKVEEKQTTDTEEMEPIINKHVFKLRNDKKYQSSHSQKQTSVNIRKNDKNKQTTDRKETKRQTISVRKDLYASTPNIKTKTEEEVPSLIESKNDKKYQSSHSQKQTSVNIRKNDKNKQTTDRKETISSTKKEQINKSPSTEKTENIIIKDEIGEYKCDKCNKICPTWKKLYLHKRSHTKAFECPLDACGKKFATKGDLIKHIRSHTGEKPYLCDLCDKSFAQNITLKQHKEKLHPEIQTFFK